MATTLSSATAFPSSTLPAVAPQCRIELEAHISSIASASPTTGLMVLGPSYKERETLLQCCHTLKTQVFSVNGTNCLRSSECPVMACGPNDPAWDCVSLTRAEWGVTGEFKCIAGKKNGADGRKVGVKGWAVVMLAVVGMAVV